MLKIRGIIFIFTLLIFLTLLFPINSKTSEVVYSQQNSSIETSLDLINAVNSLRASNGLPPYQINPVLMNIAQIHSEYQASIGTVTHFSSDGSRPFQRALAAGYPVAGDLSLGGFFSENIAAGNNFSVLDAVNSWQLDAPHLKTMLSSTLRDIGAGLFFVGNYVYYTIDVGLSTGQLLSTPIGGFPTNDLSNYPTNTTIITSTPQSDGTIVHVVQIGETIWSISLAYDVQESEIINLNSLKGDIIYVGQKLILRSPNTPTPTQTIPTRKSTVTPSPSRTKMIANTITPFENSVQTVEQSPHSQQIGVLAILIFSLLISSLLTIFWKKKTN